MNKAFAFVACFYCSLILAGTGPVKLQVTPGQQQTVTLSRLHLNRIITPFSAPQIRTIDQAEIRIEGSVLYLSSRQNEPFVVYITPHDSEAYALSLLVTPLDVPPREIQLTLPKQWRQRLKQHAGTARKFEEASDYQRTITQVMAALAKGQLPDGYELNRRHTINTTVCQQDGMVFDFKQGQQVVGHHYRVLIGTARNTTEKPLTFREHNCHYGTAAAVSLWPGHSLLPGQKRELFILQVQPEEQSIPVVRPSLLTPTPDLHHDQ